MEIIIYDHVLRTNLIYYDRLMVHQYSGGLDKTSLYISNNVFIFYSILLTLTVHFTMQFQK